MEVASAAIYPGIKTSAKQISFWVRKHRFIDKCRIIFRPSYDVLQLILKQSAFLGHKDRIFGLQKESSLGLVTSVTVQSKYWS